MQLNAMFPTRDIGNDPARIREYPMYRVPKFEDQIETLRRFKDVAGG